MGGVEFILGILRSSSYEVVVVPGGVGNFGVGWTSSCFQVKHFMDPDVGMKTSVPETLEGVELLLVEDKTVGDPNPT